MLPEIDGNVLVVRGDTVLYESSTGMADAAAGTPCTARTRFQIASVSKQFTAATVLLLAENRKLALDDPIGRWIGGCPDSWQPITLHHLLSHTSGLVHWRDFPDLDLTARTAPANVLAAFTAGPLKFAPGSSWSYSSPGYVLLATIAQRAADEPYHDLLTRTVFEPLELADTFAGMPRDRDNVAHGYIGDAQAQSFDLDSLGLGTGDIWSTTRDLVTWNRGLRPGGLLAERSRQAMFTRHARASDQADRAGVVLDGYGYGWYLGTIGGHPCRVHTGDNEGFRSLNGWLPEPDLHVVVLSNQDNTQPATIGTVAIAALSTAGLSAHPTEPGRT